MWWQTREYFWQCLLTVLLAESNTDRCVALWLSGRPVKSNYIQNPHLQNIAGTFSPHATLSCFLGFHLFLVKNTDGTLELMCSGVNGPWTLSPLAKTLFPRRKREGKITSSLSKLCNVCSLSLDLKDSMIHFLHLPRVSSVKFALSEALSWHGF